MYLLTLMPFVAAEMVCDGSTVTGRARKGFFRDGIILSV